MDDRVGTLALRVESELEGQQAASRDLAERFTRGVLERLAAALERRAPGRLVFVRRLPLSWTLRDDPASLPDEIERAAAELAAGVESTLTLDDEPPPDTDVVAFADEVALVASAVLAMSRGRVGWFHHAGGVGDPVRALLADPARAAQVLARLARREVLLEVVGRLPREAIAELARVIPAADPLSEPSIDGARTQLATRDDYTRLAPASRMLVTRVYARLVGHAGIGPGPRPAPDGQAGRAPERAAASPIAPWPASPASSSAPAPPSTTDAAAGDAMGTHHAGLFYLLAPILELSIAEALWEACLPEGELVARALAALVPDPDDPAIAVIAGAPRRDVTVNVEQVREVACTTLAAIAAALPRGGRAELPAGLVRFVEQATGRLLVVTAIDAPFVLFAWPAGHPDDAARGLAAVLARWPAGTPLFGTPAVIELERTGRCRHTIVASPAPFVLGGANAAEVALGSLIAGAAAQLVAARAGDPVTDVTAWVARRLAVRGRIVREPGLVEIWLASDAVDLDLRRAGLDRDPGHVGWIDATVRLRFEDPPITRPS